MEHNCSINTAKEMYSLKEDRHEQEIKLPTGKFKQAENWAEVADRLVAKLQGKMLIWKIN